MCDNFVIQIKDMVVLEPKLFLQSGRLVGILISQGKSFNFVNELYICLFHSQRNFIMANIDVRGTGFQGDEFKHAVYMNLGNYEVSDTLHVIRYYQKPMRN